MERIKSFLLIFVGVIIAMVVYTFRNFFWNFIYGLRNAFVSPRTPALPYLLAIIILLIILVFIFIVYLFRSSRKTPSETAGEDDAEEKSDETEPSDKDEAKETAQAKDRILERPSFSWIDIKKSFRNARKLLKKRLTHDEDQYHIPLILIVGEKNASCDELLENSGLELSAGFPEKTSLTNEACDFRFFDQGIVLNIHGDVLLFEDEFGEPEPGDEKTWRLILKHIRDFRPKRPVDGVVLTIPASDLIDSNGGVSGVETAKKKAEILLNKLMEARKIFGLRFPVYLLVTNCEDIEGFDALKKELPERMNDAIMGWSSPYTIDTAYSSEWAKEAFKEIEQSLLKLQFKILTKGTFPENAEGIFLFPGKFLSTEESLSLYLDLVFKESVYHETFIFRGLYFCGRGGTFVSDLFNRKIFMEKGLARPYRESLVSGNRKVVALQIAVIVITLIWSWGLWRNTRSLSKDIESLNGVIREVDQNVSEWQTINMEKGGMLQYAMLSRPSEGVPFRKNTVRLLKRMSQTWPLYYTFIPSSWQSGIHGKITETITLAFNDLILESLYIELIQELRRIADLAEEKPRIFSNEADIPPVNETIEFMRMDGFVRGLKELEEDTRRYNLLPESKDLKSLRVLLNKYLFRGRIPPDMRINEKYVLAALKSASLKSFDYTRFRLSLRNKLERMSDELFDRILSHNLILSYLKSIVIQLDHFDKEFKSQEEEDLLIRNFVETANRAKTVLENPNYYWVFSKTFTLGKPFDELLYIIERSEFLGKDLRLRIEEDGSSRFRKLRKSLQKQSSRLTGELLDWKNDPRHFSPALAELKAGFEKLLEQKFMAHEKAWALDVAVPPGTRLLWNIEVLKTGMELFKPYEEFRKKDIGKFPDDLRYTVANIAKGNLESDVLNIINRALEFEPVASGFSMRNLEKDLSIEVRNLKKVDPVIKELFSHLEKLNLTDSQTVISHLLELQCGRLLRNLDNLLGEENLYAMKSAGFSWWNGLDHPQLSLSSFNASDRGELEFYLKLQRERLGHLAFEYGEPLIGLYSRIGINENLKDKNLVYKWKRILLELEKAKNKSPDSSVSDLEKFILFDMDKINPNNFHEKITREQLRKAPKDYFIAKKNGIRMKLYERCRELAAQDADAAFLNMRAFFQERLAGRYPFAALTNGMDFPEADPNDIKDFFRIFDKEADRIETYLNAVDADEVLVGRTSEFLARMRDVRKLFAPWLDAKKKKKPSEEAKGNTEKRKRIEYKVPALAFDIKFRIHKDYEIMANHIIEWKMRVGGRVIQNNKGVNSGIWKYGEPVSLTLRWAKNSLDFPVFAGNNARVNPETKTVTFSFENKWSLFRFIGSFLADPGDFGEPFDPEPNTLKFIIDTKHWNPDAFIPEQAKTKTFVRVSIMNPDLTGERFKLPFFPEAAPNYRPITSGLGRNNHD